MIKTSVLTVALLGGALMAQQRATVGQAVPDFTFAKLRNGDGRQKLSDYRGQVVMLDFARHAVALGGTVSAEHGLGKRKRGLLELQYSSDQIEAMKQVKRRLDPHWLLGQDTLFPR